MRIAFFLHRFPAVSETFVLHQITGLLDLGHDVHIFSERRPAQDLEPVHSEMIEYDLGARTTYLEAEMPPESGSWSMPVWPITGETWLPGASEPILNSERLLRAVPVLLRCLEAVPQLTIESIDPDQYGEQALSLETLYHLHSLLQRPAEYDVIHAHFGPVANAFRFVRTLWDVPFVATFHGYDFSMIPKAQGHDVYDRLFDEADAITVISQYAKSQLEDLGCPQDKLHVMRMGVRLEDFPFRVRHLNDGEPVRIITVGRLVEKKGLEYVLRAIACVSERNMNIQYEIIGDGPLKSWLQRQIDELSLGSVVTLWGARDHNFVRRRMAESHLFVLASVTASDGDQEGVPVSLMEAQASGLPVLSTRHSGIPEVVAHGETGILVPERDTDALAAGLLRLIEHPQEWAQMSREGRKAVETHFNIETLTRDLVKLYEDTCLGFRTNSQAEAMPAL